jgi:endonuclease YncB( thermonuclease family)
MSAFGPYPARVQTVHDGDTIYLDIDLGFDHLISARDFDGHPRLACRVYGINAPELSTEAGKAAALFAQTLLPPAPGSPWFRMGGTSTAAASTEQSRWRTAVISAG